MSVIDTYLQDITPPSKKEALERIRHIAKRIVPDATEVISYGMPTLQYKGTSFLGFDIRTHHIGIYPYGGAEIEFFKERLTELGYGFSSGAIRVPFDHPIPEALLTDIITQRLERIHEK